jgi:hypothetical protein
MTPDLIYEAGPGLHVTVAAERLLQLMRDDPRIRGMIFNDVKVYPETKNWTVSQVVDQFHERRGRSDY